LGTLVAGDIVHNTDILTVPLCMWFPCSNWNKIQDPTDKHVSVSAKIENALFAHYPSLPKHPNEQRGGKSPELRPGKFSMLGRGGLDFNDDILSKKRDVVLTV
jgi:hypothetical protein